MFVGANVSNVPPLELTVVREGEFFAEATSCEGRTIDEATERLTNIIMRNPEFEWARPWVDPSPQQVIGSRLPLFDAVRDLVAGIRTVPAVAQVIQAFEERRAVVSAEWKRKLAEEARR